jgi:hypothetical protein
MPEVPVPVVLLPAAPLLISDDAAPVLLSLAGGDEAVPVAVAPAVPDVPEVPAAAGLALVSSCMRDELQADSAIARILPSTTP